MSLGIYSGKVVRIDARGVVVREYIKDYKGEIQPKDTILRLRKEEGE
jgi:Tfp pilus assembly protein PilP